MPEWIVKDLLMPGHLGVFIAFLIVLGLIWKYLWPRLDKRINNSDKKVDNIWSYITGKGGVLMKDDHEDICSRKEARSSLNLQSIIDAQSRILQAELQGIKSVLELVTDRQKEVITRIDDHINGTHDRERS